MYDLFYYFSIFSQATPLNSYRRHYLLKDYDYINSPDKLLFDQIKAYFKVSNSIEISVL